VGGSANKLQKGLDEPKQRDKSKGSGSPKETLREKGCGEKDENLRAPVYKPHHDHLSTGDQMGGRSPLKQVGTCSKTTRANVTKIHPGFFAEKKG